jgi:ribosomal protein S18 acetylase RimI-like enzyme
VPYPVLRIAKRLEGFFVINEIIKLFRDNLPNVIRREGAVLNVLSDEGNHIIDCRDGSKLVGVSVINEGTIYLLCVDKTSQNQGISTRLLAQSEAFITSKGFNTINLGVGKDYIMPGVPMNDSVHGFFIKHGYTHSWGNSGCIDMSQALEGFNCNDYAIGDTISGIRYRWADVNDLENTVKCVFNAEESFTSYYEYDVLYKHDSTTPVLIAEKNNEVLGAIMVNFEEGLRNNGGTLDCLVTAQQHRGKGIATTLTTLGTKHLKDIGLSNAYLCFTYTGIASMYRRIGYELYMEYFMGEKIMPR